MTFSPKTLLAAAGLLAALGVQAQQLPAGAPAGTTVQCKDGSFASPDTKSGACRGHKGIQTWYGKADAKPAAAPAVAAAPAAAAPAAAAAAAKPAARPDPSTMAAAPGGGAGKVWANDETKVYHCMGDRYYGKTKKGEYLSEAEAKAKGMHASHNKACAG
ncbi:hypothetical protein QTI17_15860 [Variovorax sp. J31P179]|uniref:DUF3761 domain-containing protein n=1 Tax=Variovorax sp. J31P179 TaxID=3053508 RepID=UPI0025756D63|nr:hypothetical protein [Variovorax sp. J31P179]MDM0082070.1 hypothetical protein [Variovorax sp. J31P179]